MADMVEKATAVVTSRMASVGVRTPTAPLLRRWWAVSAAVLAGFVLFAAFPPISQWWSAPIGVALLACAVHRRGVWAGAGLGLLTGVAFLTPLLSWAGGYIGPVWLILPVFEAGYLALLGALSALASPLVDRWRWTWPLATGALWVLQEALRDRTPFGGFPWGRLAFSQGDSPLLRLAVVGGAPLVTFGVAALGGLLAHALSLIVAPSPGHARPSRTGGPSRTDGPSGIAGPSGADGRSGIEWPVWARVLAPLGLAVVGVLAPFGVPLASANEPPVIIAIVQGNVPRLGLEFNAQRRAVLDNHVNATLALAADVAAGRAPQPDLVVWPENASDIDPLANSDARDRIDAAARTIGVPILVGGLLNGPGDRARNVGIVWDPMRGPTDTYVKRHPVPFAEYIPIRTIARMVTNKVDLVRYDLIAGPSPGVLRVGPATVGDVICFEVADDTVVRDTVLGGAGLLVVQTNNATFNLAEARQQLAMVRLRAVEHGRPALMASTVGVSGFVDPDGTVTDATSFNTAAVIVREVRPGASRTIATELGVLPELGVVIAALGMLGVALWLAGKRPKARRHALVGRGSLAGRELLLIKGKVAD